MSENVFDILRCIIGYIGECTECRNIRKIAVVECTYIAFLCFALGNFQCCINNTADSLGVQGLHQAAVEVVNETALGRNLRCKTVVFP